MFSILLLWLQTVAALAVQGPATAGAAAIATVTPAPAVEVVAERPFVVRVDGAQVPYDVMALFVLPGETLPIEVSLPEADAAVENAGGTLESTGAGAWRWTAPEEAGAYPLRVVQGDDRVTLNVFVMVPYASVKNGRIGSYRIGSYPAPRREQSNYERPRGFIRVTPELEAMQVSPHFRLGQFLCKDAGAYPKYLVLRPALLVKLERLLETANEHGVEASTFQLMSAYRTPSYNKRIGNTTSFSRHHYGDAADIFVDENRDGRMDDLNGDGRLTRADAEVLSGWAQQIERETAALVGGLSAYGATESHGPFVHVDVRGYPARW